MQMNRVSTFFVVLALAGCSAAVSDLNNFMNASDACDPRPVQHLGGDLDIQFQNTNAHINQDLRFAVEVGVERNVEALAVVSAFSDANQLIHIPEMMPADPATLAFWADSNGHLGFDQLDPPDASGMADAGPPLGIDHQWFRPVCPSGHVTFTHTTPFQDISRATSTGSIYRFHIPVELQTSALFDNYAMATWAVRVNETRQTRVYYQWHPFVALGGTTPPQRTPPTAFQVGGNVLGESRGAIDSGETYEVHFVIDVNHDGQFGGTSGTDYTCVWTDQIAVGATWEFDPATIGGGLAAICDDNGFDPVHP
jgi:hypothetical protein